MTLSADGDLDHQTMDAPPEGSSPTAAIGSRPRASALAVTGAAVVALPLVLYAVLRPENYGLTPNSLDPIFYTGYAINFDDIINAVGDRHYFVSRWSAYMPGYVADRLAGPIVGRLLWRLVLAAAILVSLWALGRRWKWTWAQRFLIGALVLTMPMFVRAFFSDYVEYFVVAIGICLVCLCLRERQTVWSALAIGAMAGSIVVANPVAVSMVGLCVLTSVVVGSTSWRGRAMIVGAVGVGCVVVVLGGLVVFRWRYGIDNVYQPSIDFIRSYSVVDDPWRSPRLEWLGKFTWLYMVPVVLVTAVAISWRRRVEFDRIEKAALVLCAVQYATHWFDQFVRSGLSLEVSFYWSFSYPTLAVAAAVVIGKLTAGIRSTAVAALGAGWLALLLIGVPDPVRLPSGMLFALVVVCVLIGATAVARAAPVVPVVALVALLGWMQIGAPHYDPSSYTAINASPLYDQLFRKAGDTSETVLHEAVWFEDEMDNVENDASTSFVTAGGWSRAIVALYAPHVVNRLVELNDDRSALAPQSILDIRGGVRPILAVYGPEPDVARIVATFPRDLGLGTKLLDETHADDLRYRLVVYAMPDATRFPFTWRADALPLLHGRLEEGRATVHPGDETGFVTFGPYTPIQPGRYTATITYSSTSPVGVHVGTFDVSPPAADGSTSVPLVGTGGVEAQTEITFTVSDPEARYEFRSWWDGVGTLAVDSVTLDRAAGA
jgi:hypothetical protein